MAVREINWHRYISVDSHVQGGAPVIKGTRVPVQVLVGSLAGGMTVEEICEQYRVTPKQVRAALAYAAEETNLTKWTDRMVNHPGGIRMQRRNFIQTTAVGVASLALETWGFAEDNTPPAGFAALFNGRDFTNWKVPEGDNGHWKVVNGVIDYDGKSEAKGRKDLWTEKEFADFSLMIDWRWSGPIKKVKHPIIFPDGTHQKDAQGRDVLVEMDEAGDSGIFLRGSSRAQVNLWCWTCGSGEVYGYRMDPNMPPEVKAAVTPKRNADKPIGEWNSMTVTMKGDRLTVLLNGYEVISNAQLPGVPPKGGIALQHHGDPVQFKNIYVKEL